MPLATRSAAAARTVPGAFTSVPSRQGPACPTLPPQQPRGGGTTSAACGRLVGTGRSTLSGRQSPEAPAVEMVQPRSSSRNTGWKGQACRPENMSGWPKSPRRQPGQVPIDHRRPQRSCSMPQGFRVDVQEEDLDDHCDTGEKVQPADLPDDFCYVAPGEVGNREVDASPIPPPSRSNMGTPVRVGSSCRGSPSPWARRRGPVNRRSPTPGMGIAESDKSTPRQTAKSPLMPPCPSPTPSPSHPPTSLGPPVAQGPSGGSTRQRRNGSQRAGKAPPCGGPDTAAESQRIPVLAAMQARPRGGGEPRLEWSSLSTKARRAVNQWRSGQIGGRHCLMLLEHDSAIAFFISPLDHDEVVMSDLRNGVVLNALSGLSKEVRGVEGGWLHSEVFEKTPTQVLDEAFLTAAQDCVEALRAHASAETRRHSAHIPAELGEGFSIEQVNLALRRRAMQAQADGMRSLLESGSDKRRNRPRCSEEFMRTQVWLELARLHVEGPPPDSCGPTGSSNVKESMHGRRVVSQGTRGSLVVPPNMWDDSQVLKELGKPEAELQTESQDMGLDALRQQNRSIEAYLMRLVRQRDQLKHMSKLAEECDFYLILGLDGPNVTDEEVKKAYRALARKEHPDKAGTENKQRFQEIQQAYSALLKRRKSACTGGEVPFEEVPQRPTSSSPGNDEQASAFAREAAARAEMAREAADAITSSAHDGFRSCAKGHEFKTLAKRTAMRELQALGRRVVEHFRDSASHLRLMQSCSGSVATCAETALAEYGEWADTAMAGAGLKERTEVMQTVGESCASTAEHLERLGNTDEAHLQRMERVSTDADATSGIRLLVENLARTAIVMRCAADEAIGAATTCLELSCSLAVLDRQRRVERSEKEAERQQSCDSPREAGSQASEGPDREGDSQDKQTKEKGTGSKDKPKGARQGAAPRDADEAAADTTPRTAAQGDPRSQVKHQQAALRVRHLQCMGSLNEEVLALQGRLRGLLGRNEGLRLPEVGATQKGGVFDLVAQLLQAALSEAARLAAESTLPSRQVLEKTFAFALALEHARHVAVPAEVRTQAFKLAALLDIDLLCQIIDGPFKQRLLNIEKCRPAALRNLERMGTIQLECQDSFERSLPRRSKSNGVSMPRSSGGGVWVSHSVSDGLASMGQGQEEAWGDAVHSMCARVVACLREPVGSQGPAVNLTAAH